MFIEKPILVRSSVDKSKMINICKVLDISIFEKDGVYCITFFFKADDNTTWSYKSMDARDKDVESLFNIFGMKLNEE